MPRVPASTGPQVESTALRGGFQNPNADPDAFGAAQGRQLAQLGQAGMQAANDFDKVLQRKDADDAMRVEVKIKTDWQATERDLRKRRGKNAEGLVTDAEAWWQKAAEEHSKELTPRAKALITQSLGSARMSAVGTMGRYQEQELDRSFMESTNANIAVEIERYATAADPKGADASRSIIKRDINLIATRMGWAPEQAEAEEKRYTNLMHRQMIDRLTDWNPAEAKAYYDKYRDEVAGSAHATVERQINGAVNEQEAGKRAAEMATLPYDQQLAKTAEIKDPALREATRKRVKEQQQDIQMAEAAREREVSDKVWQLVGQNVPLSRLPRSLLDKMDGKERVQVNEHYDAIRRRNIAEAKGASVKTDWTVYTDLRALPPEELAKVKLSTYVDKLAGPQLEQLADLQTKLKDPKKQGEAATQTQQLKVMTGPGGLDLNKEKAGQFESATYDAFNTFIKEKGREPNFTERQTIMDDLAKDVVLKRGWLWDTTKPAYQLPAGQRQGAPEAPAPAVTAPTPPRNTRVVVINGADRSAITDALRAKGVPVTEENIQRVYQRQEQGNAR